MPSAVAALEFGADDCLALPFEPSELVARVNACLRRPLAMIRPDQLTAGPLVLDKAVHRLLVRGQEVALSPAEFRLLAFLLENQGRVFSRDELLRGAWPKNITAGGRTVDVHVRRLRQLLEPFACDDIIQTVRSFGYRLVPPSRDGQLVAPANSRPRRGCNKSATRNSFSLNMARLLCADRNTRLHRYLRRAAPAYPIDFRSRK